MPFNFILAALEMFFDKILRDKIKSEMIKTIEF